MSQDEGGRVFACVLESVADLDFLLADPVPTCIVSVDPCCSYELHRRGLPFLEAADLLAHEQAWARYPQRLAKSFALCKRLDALLWEKDSRFGSLRWSVFDDLHYILKITLDQLTHYADILCAARMRYPEAEFKVAVSTGIVIDEYGLLDPASKVFGKLLKTNASSPDAAAYGLPMTTMSASGVASIRPSTYSFGQPKEWKDQFASLRETGDRANLEANRGEANPAKATVLSVASREVSALKRNGSLLRDNSIYIVEWPTHGERRIGETALVWRHMEAFIDQLGNDAQIAELTAYQGFDFRSIMLPIIAHVSGCLEELLHRYTQAKEVLHGAEVKAMVFQSMAPFFLPNLYLRKWCQENSVPYATWMHGGFGATYSMAGYDVTDLRMSPSFLSYGHHLRPALEDGRSTLAQMGMLPPNVAVTGSPYNDALYAAIPPRAPSRRHRILFAVGAQIVTHQFHYGFNRPRAESSFWRAHFEVIRLLSKFQDAYDIVVKDYPWSKRAGLWKQMIADAGGERLTLIVGEAHYDELVKECDLLIVPWVSTTFFEGLYPDADIFVFDDGDVTDIAKAALAEGAYYYSDLNCLLDGLSEYLSSGRFYTRNKTGMRNLFLDYSRKDSRGEVFMEFLATQLGSERAGL